MRPFRRRLRIGTRRRPTGSRVGSAVPETANPTRLLDSAGRLRFAGSAEIDALIAEIASRQHGVVTRRQLLEAGVGRTAIDHRLARSRLHPLHRGVFLVGHPVRPPLAREMAAVLACGDGAFLSHRAACAVQGLGVFPCPSIEVTITARNCRSREGLLVHRTRYLHPDERSEHRGVPVTTPARTLVDLAQVLSPAQLRRPFEQAGVLGVVRPADLEEVISRARRRHGTPALRALITEGARPAMTRSEAEARLLDLVRAAGLPPSATNTHVGRHEVDLVWRRERLIVEVDGFAYHGSRMAFERDRLRDGELQAAGYRVVRVTWRQLADRPHAVVARLAQALARSGPDG